jgi:beta-glucosidase
VIVVVMAGRPLVMNEQLDGAAAALMAFLPGSEGGSAIADTLFGNFNPSGRLTVSWPKSSDQQPLAYNEPGTPYDPRYPFGYGLSYSDVDVVDLDAPSDVGRRGRVPIHVALSNSSPIGGDHIVLAIVERLEGPTSAAPRQLVAFTRTTLQGNDVEDVRLGFRVEQLAVTQEDGSKSVLPGEYRLVVGGQSRTFRVH